MSVNTLCKNKDGRKNSPVYRFGSSVSTSEGMRKRASKSQDYRRPRQGDRTPDDPIPGRTDLGTAVAGLPAIILPSDSPTATATNQGEDSGRAGRFFLRVDTARLADLGRQRCNL